MPRIIPIRDLRDTNKISEMCHASNEPIFVTKNGYGDMVIMSTQQYEEVVARITVRDKIIEGLKSAQNEQTADGRAFFADMRKKYEL